MRRRFTVNANQKIQAAPIDFDAINDMESQSKSRTTPERIQRILNDNKSELLSYIDVKINKEVINKLDSDIRNLCEKYPDLEDYFGCGSFPIHNQDSCVVGIEFNSCGAGVNEIRMEPEDERWEDDYSNGFFFEGNWNSACVFYDMGYEFEDTYCIPDIEPTDLFNLLSWELSLEDVYPNLSLDNIVSTFEELVYSYADFIDAVISEYVMQIMQEYFDNYDGGE